MPKKEESMSYQPDSHTSSAEVQSQQQAQQSSGQKPLYASDTGPSSYENPHMKYTMINAVVGFLGALLVLYTQSLGGTFFIFLSGLIGLYRGIRAFLYARSHPGAPGLSTGIIAIVLGAVSLIIMIYLLAAVGVK
jgi:hypothetical protein